MEETMIRVFPFVMVVLFVFGHVSEAQATEVKFEDWRRDQPCGHKLTGSLQTNIRGCETAYCVNISDSSQIYACLPSRKSDEARIIFKKNGGVILQWDAVIYPADVASAFRVDTADLNGDGRDEFVIAAMGAVSNGMDVSYWKVWVLSDDKLSNPVDVEDYGLTGFLSSNGKQCRLLVTRWIEGWEPKRGYGLYLVGRWFQLYDNELQYTSVRPAIKRRYLNSLALMTHMRQQGAQDGKPVMWFRDRQATPIVGPYPFRE
jgi:hypothetical protein